MKTLIEQFVKEALTGKNQFTFSFGQIVYMPSTLNGVNPDLSMDVILVIVRM